MGLTRMPLVYSEYSRRATGLDGGRRVPLLFLALAVRHGLSGSASRRWCPEIRVVNRTVEKQKV